MRREDQSPSASPRPEYDKAALSTLVGVLFINLLGFGLIVPLLPFYGQAFHAPAWQVTLLFSAYPLGAFFGEPVWGSMSDRVGRKPLLVSTVAGNCLCYLALAFATNWYLAFTIRLIGGVMSGNGAVVQGYIADVTSPDKRAGRMALLGAAYNFGFIVGPSLGGLLARPELGVAGFRPPILTACVLSAASALCIILFVRESRMRVPGVASQASRLPPFAAAVHHPVVSRLLVVTFLAGSAFTCLEASFALWGEHRFHWGPRDIGLIFGGVGITAAISQGFLTGRLSQRFGSAPMLVAGMILTSIATLALPLAKGMVSVTALMALVAFGQSVAYPNVIALITRAVDGDRRGGFLGVNNAGGAAARVAGPLAGGALITAGLYDGAFVLAALITVPAIFLSVFVGRAMMLHRAGVASRPGLP